MTKLIVAFCNFANAPKNEKIRVNWVVTQNTTQNALRVFCIGPLTLENDITTWSRNVFSTKTE